MFVRASIHNFALALFATIVYNCVGEKRQQIFRTKYNLLNFWLDVAVITAFLAVLAYIFFWPIRVEGGSMAPTLSHNDRIIGSRFLANFGNLSVGDIVLVQIDDRMVIKRLAALSGDHIMLMGDVLYINGMRADWPLYGESRIDVDMVLPDGMYYLLGDNLLTSHDSRHHGPTENRHILAKILMRYFPLNDIKIY